MSRDHTPPSLQALGCFVVVVIICHVTVARRGGVDLTGARLLRGGRFAARKLDNSSDFQQVALECVDEPLCLPMLARRADADDIILDNVPDSETVRRCGTETELPQARVPAVRRRQDRVVQSVPTPIGEDRRHRS